MPTKRGPYSSDDLGDRSSKFPNADQNGKPRSLLDKVMNNGDRNGGYAAPVSTNKD